MNAVVKEVTPTDTLLSQYATPEEILAARAKCEAIDVAEEKVAHVVSVLQTVTGQIHDARRYQLLHRDRAAAVLLGEAEPVTEPGLPLSQLQEQQKGLEDRAEAAREAVKEAKGRFRAAVHDLVRACADRCAEDYARLTNEQAWCHQQLSVAQALIGNVVDPTWNRYFVPASTYLSALKNRAREEHFVPTLMSADRLSVSEQETRRKVADTGERLFSVWPL